MDSIKCPHCGKQVELSEAIIHELSKAQVDKARAEEKEKTERQERDKALRESRQKDKEIEEMRRKLAKKDEEEKIREEKIRVEAQKDAEKGIELKLKEKDITIDQIKKANEEIRKVNEDLKRKIDQGSQQLQGEALEQDFEEKLHSLFPNDEFLPVPKGVKGGDILQNVRNKFGQNASIIIWEFKRTKTWDKNWLEKLRNDARTAHADEAIIVSEVLPEKLEVYEKIDGVWVTSRKYAFALASLLREMGLRVAVAKSGAKHDDEKLKAIYDYIMSVDFKHIVEKEVETVSKSIKLLDKKHDIDEKYYKSQRNNLEALKDNASQIYFDLQKRLPALPAISGLEIEDLVDGEDEKEQTLF